MSSYHPDGEADGSYSYDISSIWKNGYDAYVAKVCDSITGFALIGSAAEWLGDMGAVGVPGWTVRGIGDLNADGHPDVVWQNDATGQVAVWYLGGPQGNIFQSGNWLSEEGVPGWKVIVR